MCNSLRSAAPIRGRQSNRDADMLEILQSGSNKLRQFSYLLGGILLPRKCQLFELVKCGKLMLCHVLLADGIEVAIFLIGQKLFDDDLELLVRREVSDSNQPTTSPPSTWLIPRKS